MPKPTVRRPATGVTLSEANDLIAIACREADAIGIPMAFVVVDAVGHMVSAQRMMEARWMGIDIAHGKAYTAAAFAEPTHIRAEKAKALLQFTTSLAAMTAGRYVAQDGGFPLIRNGLLYGGIGASGGVGEEDDRVLLPALKAAGFDVPH
jgi:glc operon protein GlcG